jgi:signal transduction histidine kinase
MNLEHACADFILGTPSGCFASGGEGVMLRTMDDLPLFMYLQRPDYSIAYANKLTRKNYSISFDDPCYKVFSNRSSPCRHCPTFKVFETGRPADWQYVDAEKRVFHLHDYPFADRDGNPLVLEIGIETTNAVHLERQLCQARKMKSMGLLAGGLAHDLNNDLLPVIFNLDYALNRVEDPEVGAALREALRGACLAAELVEQVQIYGRQQATPREPMDLNLFLREHLNPFRATLPPDIRLGLSLCPGSGLVYANRTQLRQLLLNLCRNAVEAMPGGGLLRVESSIERLSEKSSSDSPPPGDYALLRVRDTGCGIDADRLEHVFEPFYSGEKSGRGMGLGLALARFIARDHGGHIFVQSRERAGTQFSVYLPLADRRKKLGVEIGAYTDY